MVARAVRGSGIGGRSTRQRLGRARAMGDRHRPEGGGRRPTCGTGGTATKNRGGGAADKWVQKAQCGVVMV
jgi:hypothetical protein